MAKTEGTGSKDIHITQKANEEATRAPLKTGPRLVWFMVFNATFNNYFSYIMTVSFIGGGNRSTRRKPPTCRKSLTNFFT
jgi:hypothetical protein